MKQRLVIALILFSMVLHCSSRVGLLSYLYQQRHEIAYTIGLITEIPIALCSSDYDFNSKLTIQEDRNHEPISTVFQAREIILFFDRQIALLSYEPILLGQVSYFPYSEAAYGAPHHGIFQPPRV